MNSTSLKYNQLYMNHKYMKIAQIILFINKSAELINTS